VINLNTTHKKNKIHQFLIKEESEKFSPLYDYVEGVKNQINASASAVYVIQGNKVIGEWYSGYDPVTKQKVKEDTRYNVFSVRKSYIGLAVEILINQGKIHSLEDKVLDYLDTENQTVCKDISIRHIVTHTHGLRFENNELIKFSTPGTVWEYNGAGLSLLYKIISKVSGSTVNEIIQDYVFQPLNFIETGWEIEYKENLLADVIELEKPSIRLEDNTGFERNLFVSARELAHWGYFHLKKGLINGEQVIPSSFLERTTSIQTPENLTNTPQNGYFWFRNENKYAKNELGEKIPPRAYQILGASGCACLVIPEYDAVAVRMYNKRGNPPSYDYLRDIKNFGNLIDSILK
jgi:CubicO group peptidase (beta-lactamase class C family)